MASFYDVVCMFSKCKLAVQCGELSTGKHVCIACRKDNSSEGNLIEKQRINLKQRKEI
jgi:hypothetical protein